MQYIEVTFRLSPVEPMRELLVDALGNEGPFDSFEETADGLRAYVPRGQYSEQFVADSIATIRTYGEAFADTECTFEAHEMPDVNWNAEWERNHQSIIIERPCRIYVRAPFHPHRDDVDYELVIEPKMSFGTAHHQTTRMMLSLIAAEPLEGRMVLDMGTGTGVLAILAKMRGAEYVEAIDVDEWAYSNAVENAERNGVQINPRLGDATTLSGEFDVVLANINRNILLRDMQAYAAVLRSGGVMMLSGFYEHDVEALTRHAATLGLQQVALTTEDGWAAIKLLKTN